MESEAVPVDVKDVEIEVDGGRTVVGDDVDMGDTNVLLKDGVVNPIMYESVSSSAATAMLYFLRWAG
jgi:hypothetical protein